jgi:hypothetical protein
MQGEQPRPDANTDDTAYSLTVEEAAQHYDAAGHSRTLRAIQKYCLRGDLDCMKQDTVYGQRYRITPESVARHLAQIDELTAAKGRGQSRPAASVPMAAMLVATGDEPPASAAEQSRPDAPVREGERNESTPVRDQPRPDAADARYIGSLERENDFLRDQIGRKDHQIEQRDIQIQSMIERDRETNFLIQGLQRMLGLGSGQPPPSGGDAGDNSEHRA